MTLPARRYATALFTAARQKDAVAAVAGDLEFLHATLQDPDVRAAVTSPDVGSTVRRQVLEKLTEGRHELTCNLIQVLLRRHREPVLPDLQPEFHTMMLADRGEVEGVVQTPRPVGEPELERLTALAGRLSGKKVTLKVEHDPELIGGVRLRVANELYDGSVQNALEQLQRQLLEAPM